MVWLQHIEINYCRLLQQVKVDLSAQVNVLTGNNGSGKSSFIEALCVLSRGRSFRTPRISEVMSRGQTAMWVAGRVHTLAYPQGYPLGIHKTTQQTRIRINHADVKQQAELSRHLPLTVIHPDTIDLATGSPPQRRALLDWIAFYLEPEFHLEWQAFQKVIKQRNACLRDSRQRYALNAWTDELIRLQPRIDAYRLKALAALESALHTKLDLLASMGRLRLKLQTGFPQLIPTHDRQSLQHFLLERREVELRYGTSLYGAHRADLVIELDEQLAARVASRGQLKLLGIALLLAQSEAITRDEVKRGIIAIDDLASELDPNNQQLLYQVLGQAQQQLIITATCLSPDLLLPTQTQLFHVEHGQIRPV